ncbi:glycosyltransferase family 2 protein [Roseivivax sp.]
MPRASIVVPAFNAEATLAETLASLTAQSFTDLEIIVVDDGSTDATARIARAHMSDARIRLVSQPNRGLAGARNTGILEARGAYIGFCDADDLWRPEKLAVHVAHLDAAPEVGLSFSGSVLIDGAGRPTGHAQKPRLRQIDAAHVFKRNPIGNGSAAVMRREAAEALVYYPRHAGTRACVFDETFRQSEDIECWMRLMLTTGWSIEGVPGLLTAYRVNGAGLSANTERQHDAWERMVEKLTPLAPEFFARVTPAARAYQLRYLARRAVSALDGPRAVQLALGALATSRRPLLEEPVKTLTTLAAALVLGAGGSRLLKPVLGLSRAGTRPA